jgi:hypothetical protein
MKINLLPAPYNSYQIEQSPVTLSCANEDQASVTCKQTSENSLNDNEQVFRYVSACYPIP